ncbi:MAG: hypothetical protein WBP82_02870, partial [Leuconostoc mesenteroides]
TIMEYEKQTKFLLKDVFLEREEIVTDNLYGLESKIVDLLKKFKSSETYYTEIALEKLHYNV